MIQYEPDLPSVTESSERQEAESLRYGATAFMILPLSTGRVAVLGSMRSLHAICDTLEEAIEASLTIPMLVWRRNVEKPKPTGIDLSTLDFKI